MAPEISGSRQKPAKSKPIKSKQQQQGQKRKRDHVDVEKLEQAVENLVSPFRTSILQRDIHIGISNHKKGPESNL